MKFISLSFILLAAACGGGSDNGMGFAKSEIASADMEALEYAPVTRQGEEGVVASQPEVEKKIIKTGSLSYKVESTENEYSRVSTLLSSFQAYLASENQSKGYDRINYSLTIKVPPQHFDSLMIRIAEGNKIDNRWVNIDDVTERYYDLQSRIENKKKLEERYQDILKRANSVKDILEIERSLNQVRTEIESLEGQFKLLRHRISFSTLDLTFYEILPYTIDGEQRPGFWARISNATSGGWQGFLSFMVFLVRLWPFIILAFFAVLGFRRIRARRKKK